MCRARVAVPKAVSGQLSVTAAAAEYGYSRRHVHRLLVRYRNGGLDAVEPRSRRPIGSSSATPPEVRQRVLELRGQLTADGRDAGPEPNPLAPRTRADAGSLDLDDPSDPPPGRIDHSAAR